MVSFLGTTALALALLSGCVAGSSRGYDYDSNWDYVGCRGEAQRSGLYPGESFDNYVSNCVYDRTLDRWRDWKPDIDRPNMR